MLLSLALTLSLSATPAPESAVHLTASPRSAFLLSQSPPPLPVRPEDVQPPAPRQLELQRDIDAINDDLRGLKTDWPTVSVVLAYLGFGTAPVALIGLLLLALGSVSGFAAVTLVGVVIIVIGLGGLALGIVGVVTGLSASASATNTRNDLLKQRGELERELKLLKQGGPGVDRSFESSPRLITIAAF